MGSQGVILIITLWILVILILFVFGLGFRMSLEARLTDYNATEIKNLYRVKAAVNMLKAVISEDGTEAYDYLGDNWSYSEELFKDIEVGENGGTFTISYVREDATEQVFYGAVDEESKININEIAKRAGAGDQNSRNVLMNLFLEADNAEEILDSVLDWVDEDSTPRAEGAETSDYETFGDFDYECKNGPLDSIEELLLIKGMTPAIFRTVKDRITVFGEGKVNLNTAGREVMQCLGLHESLIDEIIREITGGGEEPAEYSYFNSVEEVKNLLPGLGLTPDEISKMSEILGNLAGVKSDYFRAHITAKSKDGKIIKKAEAVVSRSGEESETIFWYESH